MRMAYRCGRDGDKDLAGLQIGSHAAEPQLAGSGQVMRLHFQRAVAARLQFGNACSVDVKAQHRAKFAEFDGQRQAHISQADDGDLRVR